MEVNSADENQPGPPRPVMVSFARGQEIFAENSLAEHVYISLNGTISLWKGGQRLIELSSQHALGVEARYNRTGTHSYTAQAETLCRLARYPLSALDGGLMQSPRLSGLILASLSGQLEQSWLKMSQSVHGRDMAFYPGDIKSYGPGEVVIREGDTSTEIFRIISTDKGLQVSKGGRDLALLREPGEFFGEMATLLHEPRTATVRSLGHSVIESYPGDQLLDIFEDYPDLSLRMIRTVVQRLAQTTRALAEKDQKPE